MSAAAVVRLDAARARALTRELRKTLVLAVELVRELHEHDGWRALGYDSWPEFCRAELPELAVIVRGMPREERDAKVSELRRGGMSLRDVAEVTGLAPNTVRAASAGVVLETVRSRDGALRPARAAAAVPAPKLPTTERLVALLAGEELTVREVVTRSRLPREVVAPALCRLAAAGRLVYSAPERRGLFGTYAGRIEP